MTNMHQMYHHNMPNMQMTPNMQQQMQMMANMQMQHQHHHHHQMNPGMMNSATSAAAHCPFVHDFVTMMQQMAQAYGVHGHGCNQCPMM
jgi:hypothetical protein